MTKRIYLLLLIATFQCQAMQDEEIIKPYVHKHIPSLWAFAAKGLSDPDQKPTYERDEFGIYCLKDPYTTATTLYEFIKTHARRVYGSVSQEPNNFDNIVMNGLTFKRSTYHDHAYYFPTIDCLWMYLNYQIDPNGFDGDTFRKDFLANYLEEPAVIHSFLGHLNKRISITLTEKTVQERHEDLSNREQENEALCEPVTNNTPQQTINDYFSKALARGQIDQAIELYKNHNARIPEDTAKEYREKYISCGAFRLARLMDDIIDQYIEIRIKRNKDNIEQLKKLAIFIETHSNDNELLQLLQQQLVSLQRQLPEK